MIKKIFAAFTIILLVFIMLFSGCLENKNIVNHKPFVEITFPKDGMNISNYISVYGDASDPDGNNTLVNVQVKIDNDNWIIANGTTNWTINIEKFLIKDGNYIISARSWDGKEYSDTKNISINVDLPNTVLSDSHKWAIFITADNFPKENESKLGNGGLYLAENISSYFIENFNYSTSNIYLLFDDGWIRGDNGYGNPIATLQERPHKYNITYGAAKLQSVIKTIDNVISESNKYDDSEVFIWFFGHGYGNANQPLTGGKLLKNSAIFLWDSVVTDTQFGEYLTNLQSKKTCVMIDACYSGGFADKTIYNLPEFFILNSGIAKSGRVVISSTSKFRLGYASTIIGPLFTNIWFQGLTSGDADGFRPGILQTGRPTILRIFKDGKVSVEEAFYYTRYVLRRDLALIKYRTTQPQINDQYPAKGFLRSMGGMFL